MTVNLGPDFANTDADLGCCCLHSHTNNPFLIPRLKSVKIVTSSHLDNQQTTSTPRFYLSHNSAVNIWIKRLNPQLTFKTLT